jgi:hypothetical protein
LRGALASVIFAEHFMLRLLAILLLSVTACSFGPGNIQSKHATDIEARKIRRIAVIPPSVLTTQEKPRLPYTSAPATERRSSEQEPNELLARLVYSAIVSMSKWQIVSESEVREVAQTVAPGGGTTRLRKIAEMVYADAAIVGRVERYRERIGDEWGAKSPASVAFVVDLIDIRRGDIVWSARFDETQKPLTENIFALGDIGQRGIKWLNAEQLTHEGVKKALAQLHQVLGRSPAS